ncbi:hypothetical protein BH20ACT10_BH20ACT10_13110 [soil metagenome]|jgi:hypothetical protein|nr:hypothetical protein [Rubrobacter sp.]
MSSWSDAALLLASLSDEGRDAFSRHSGIALPDDPEDPEGIEAALASHASENGGTPAELFASTGAMAGATRDTEFAVSIGEAALEMSETPDERQLAHVCLAQTHFRNRKEEKHLASFEAHCSEAIELGAAGTFCYERLATLYEYRKEYGRAAEVSRRAVDALADGRSVERFRGRLARLGEKLD